MYLWHRIFIVITPWISFYLRLSFAKCQGNCEPLSLRRCILPDLISRIQPFFNIMLCRIFFYFCLFCHKCTSLICIYYLFEAWPNKVAWYIIELQLFFFFFFAFSPKIHLPLPRSWIHACCYKLKTRIDFSLNRVVILGFISIL